MSSSTSPRRRSTTSTCSRRRARSTSARRRCRASSGRTASAGSQAGAACTSTHGRALRLDGRARAGARDALFESRTGSATSRPRRSATPARRLAGARVARGLAPGETVLGARRDRRGRRHRRAGGEAARRGQRGGGRARRAPRGARARRGRGRRARPRDEWRRPAEAAGGEVDVTIDTLWGAPARPRSRPPAARPARPGRPDRRSTSPCPRRCAGRLARPVRVLGRAPAAGRPARGLPAADGATSRAATSPSTWSASASARREAWERQRRAAGGPKLVVVPDTEKEPEHMSTSSAPRGRPAGRDPRRHRADDERRARRAPRRGRARRRRADRAVGPDLEVPEGAHEIDAAGGIVMPGMIDTHRHMWQTALRGYGADWTLSPVLRLLLPRVGKIFRPQDIHAGNLLSAIESLDAGVTTTVDWSHGLQTVDHADAAVDALEAVPGRFVLAYGNIQQGPWEWATSARLPPLRRPPLRRRRTTCSASRWRSTSPATPRSPSRRRSRSRASSTCRSRRTPACGARPTTTASGSCTSTAS